MENVNTISNALKSAIQRFEAVNATITGPETAKNDKQYFVASFKVNVKDDDGYIGQSKLYKKVFFEDTHSLLFLAAQEAKDNNVPLKIKAGRIQWPTDKPFYILDADGERMKKKDGSYRIGKSITMFLIADENPQTIFDAQCAQITNNNAWVNPEVADEDLDLEEEKVEQLTDKKGKKK